MYTYKHNLIFNDAAIHESEYDWLYDFVKKNNIKNVLEFGLGVSTYCFLENDCNITTFETSLEYSKKFTNLSNKCKIINYKKEDILDISLNERFDLAFVDGPFGTKSLSRLNSCLFSMRYSDHILLHDFQRVGEKETAKFITDNYKDWNVITIETKRKLGYFFKKHKLL